MKIKRRKRTKKRRERGFPKQIFFQDAPQFIWQKQTSCQLFQDHDRYFPMVIGSQHLQNWVVNSEKIYIQNISTTEDMLFLYTYEKNIFWHGKIGHWKWKNIHNDVRKTRMTEFIWYKWCEALPIKLRINAYSRNILTRLT